MCLSVAAPRLRSLLILALWALPMAADAQRPALVAVRPAAGAPGDALASPDSVVVVEAVRVRTAPSPSSLSIDQVASGTVLAIEAGSALGGPWIAVRFDDRTAFVPREYVTVKLAPRAPTTAMNPAPAPQAPVPPPTRVATTVVDAARSAAPVPQPPASAQQTQAPVREASPPAREPAAPVRDTPAPARETSAAVVQAGAPLRAEPRKASEEAPAMPRVSPASATPAPAPASQTAPAAGTPAPGQAKAQADAQDPSRLRRPALPGMVSIALLGTVTSYTVTATTSRVLHVSGHTLVTLHAFGFGLYAAPEFGAGAGHRSTMLGGGIMRDILNIGPVHVSALAGATTYSEEPDGYYASSFVSRSLRAASGGALLSLPLIGPARLAYRVQYLRGLGDQSTFTQLRHAAGLQF